MKKIFTIILMCTVLSGYAQITFEKTFGGASDDIGYSVQQTNDGGYIIAGWTQSFGAGNSDGYLLKTNEAGDILWTKTFGGIGWDDCYSVQQTNDDGFIIAGQTNSFGAGNNDVYLVKTNMDGIVVSDNETITEQNDFTVFPNPANDRIEITGPLNGIFEIVSIQGQTINTLNLSGTKTAVDISKLSGGVYTLRIKTDIGIEVRKFIKQ